MKTFTQNTLACFLFLFISQFVFPPLYATNSQACDEMTVSNMAFTLTPGCPGGTQISTVDMTLDVNYPISSYTLRYEINYSGGSTGGTLSSFDNAFESALFSGFGQPATLQLFDETNGCQSDVINFNIPDPGTIPIEIADINFELHPGCPGGSIDNSHVDITVDVDYIFSGYNLRYEIDYAGGSTSGSMASFDNLLEVTLFNGFGQPATIQLFDESNGCQSELISFNIPDPGTIPIEIADINFELHPGCPGGSIDNSHVDITVDVDYIFSGYNLRYEIDYAGGSTSGSMSSFDNLLEVTLFNGFGLPATIQLFDESNGCQSELISFNIPDPGTIPMEVADMYFVHHGCENDLYVDLHLEIDFPFSGYELGYEIIHPNGSQSGSESATDNILDISIFNISGPATIQLFDLTPGCSSEVIDINIPEPTPAIFEIANLVYYTSGCPHGPPGSVFTVARLIVDYPFIGYELDYIVEHDGFTTSGSESPTDNILEIPIAQGFGPATLQLIDQTRGCEGEIFLINIPDPQPRAPEVGSYTFRQVGCPGDPPGTAYIAIDVEIVYPIIGYNLGYVFTHGDFTSTGLDPNSDNFVTIHVYSDFGPGILQFYDQDSGCEGLPVTINVPELSEPKIVQYNLEQFGCPNDPGAYTELTVEVTSLLSNYTLGYELYLDGVLAQTDNENPTDNFLEISIQNYAGSAELRVIDLDHNCYGDPLLLDIPEIEDNEAPIIICPNGTFTFDADDFYCTTFVDIPVPQTADNCGVVSLVNDFNGTNNASGNFPIGETKVTWTVTDIGPNTSSCSIKVTIKDQMPPIVICQDISVELGATGVVAITAADVTTILMDNCAINAVSLSQSSFDCTESGENSVTVTVSDNGGLTSSCVAQVNVIDSDSHDFYVTPFVFLELDEFGMASLSETDLNDTGGGICTNYTLDINPNVFGCDDAGSSPNPTSVTVTFTDGYTFTKNIWVFVSDPILPIATCQDLTVELDHNLFTTIDPADVDGGSWDACGITNMSLNRNRFNCASLGLNEVLLTVEDEAGNSSNCIALVAVIDDEQPSPCNGHSNFAGITSNEEAVQSLDTAKKTENNQLKVFPNPAKTYVKIDIKAEEERNGEVTIFDQTGKLVYQKLVAPNYDSSYKIIVEDWIPGLYVVKFETDSGIIYHRKLVLVKG